MPKGIPKRPVVGRVEPPTEYMIRFRYPGGAVKLEITFRELQYQMVAYFPSGDVSGIERGHVDHLIEVLKQIQAERGR